jgi:hypothetical protein
MSILSFKILERTLFKAEIDLREVMEQNEFHALNSVLSKILNDKMDIDVKL